MSKSNIKKSEQLGMSYGKASNILRKNITFSLIEKTGQNICYRCGKAIETVNEMSIEHKVPWLDSNDPTSLFFDIDNIAFSHQKCNSSAIRRGTSRERSIECQVEISSKTGYKNVRQFPQKKNPYQVVIKVDKISKSFGYYKTPEEAATVADRELIRIRGESAITNSKLGLI